MGVCIDYKDEAMVRDYAHKNLYTVVECDFKGSRSLITLVDNQGYYGVIKMGNFIRDNKRPVLVSSTNPYSILNIKKWVSKNAPNLTVVSDKYKGDKFKVHFKCKHHGDYYSYWSNVKRGNNCPNCPRIGYDEVVDTFKKYGYTLITSKEDYSGNNQKFDIINNEGYKTQSTLSSVSRYSPLLFSDKNSHTLYNIRLWLKRNCNDLEIVDGNVYKNAHTHLRVRCVRHNEEISITWNNIRNGKGCKKCHIESVSGKGNHNYNPSLTDRDRELKRLVVGNGYSHWREGVFSRDEYTCQICGQVGGHLNAHHKNGWDKFPDERLELMNGVTLCYQCHKRFHKQYGKGNNTVKQYREFINKTIPSQAIES